MQENQGNGTKKVKKSKEMQEKKIEKKVQKKNSTFRFSDESLQF